MAHQREQAAEKMQSSPPDVRHLEEARQGARDRLYHGAMTGPPSRSAESIDLTPPYSSLDGLSAGFLIVENEDPDGRTNGYAERAKPATLGALNPPATLAGQTPVPQVRFLIVDDCTLNRENLGAMFAAHGCSEPAMAWDMPSLFAALGQAAPEIVLFNMGTRDNMTLLRQVRYTCPQARLIVVGISDEDESEIVACAEAGVAAYHLRGESLHDLLTLVTRVADGESHCSPKVSAILLRRLSTLASQRQPEAKELVLTAREIQILRLLESGLSNQEVADRLFIALPTVKNHVHSVLRKLGVSTRGEAAAYSRSMRHHELAAEI